jgi:Ca2+-binding RTX toxin-like protein
VAARRRRLSARGLAAAPLAVVLAVAFVAFAATNVVPATNAGTTQLAVTPDALKPAACAGITLTSLVIGSGTIDGTDSSELILGGAGSDDMDGKKGSDCMLGGDGADPMRGSQDTDVCIGGPGVDAFHPTCETQIQ